MFLDCYTSTTYPLSVLSSPLLLSLRNPKLCLLSLTFASGSYTMLFKTIASFFLTPFLLLRSYLSTPVKAAMVFSSELSSLSDYNLVFGIRGLLVGLGFREKALMLEGDNSLLLPNPNFWRRPELKLFMSWCCWSVSFSGCAVNKP